MFFLFYNYIGRVKSAKQIGGYNFLKCMCVRVLISKVIITFNVL